MKRVLIELGEPLCAEHPQSGFRVTMDVDHTCFMITCHTCGREERVNVEVSALFLHPRTIRVVR